MNARLRSDEQKMTALKFVAIPDAFDDQRMMNLLEVCVYEGLSLWRDEKKSEWASKQVYTYYYCTWSWIEYIC